MKILLVDLPSVVYPLWHLSSREPDPDWTSTTALARIRSMASRYDKTAICIDKGRSFRKDMDPTYKANRPEREAALVHQMDVTRDRLADDGFPVWGASGFEADDVIASAALKAVEGDHEVIIASADKDLLQLVFDGVTVHSPMTGNLVDSAGVLAKFGVLPAQMRDYLTLTGDSSDNIAGVPGIGAKRAADLLTKFETLDRLLDRLLNGESAAALGLTPSMYKALTESSDVIARARELVTLHTDAPINFDELFTEPVTAPTPTGAPQMTDLIEQMDPPVETAPDPPEGHRGTTQALAVTTEPRAMTVEPFSGAWERACEPRSARDVLIIAKTLFASRLFSAYGNEHAVAATIYAGRELGLGMMASLRGFHTVEGKPTMAADLIRALVLASGKAEYLVCKSRTAEAATWITKRKGDPCEAELSYSLEEAKTARLIKPGSGWEKHISDMIAKTASSKLCRLVYPDVTFGLYSPAELGADEE